VILEVIGYGSANQGSIYEQYHSSIFVPNCRLFSLGKGNLILSLGGLIPGHLMSIALIDVVGRKKLQIAGFAALTVLFCIIGFPFYSLSTASRLVLFCLCNFVANAGPNTSTFVVPGELFPTRYKATAYGISAASGKIGSIISQTLWGALKDKGGPDAWVNHVMEIYALFMYSSSTTVSDVRLLGVGSSFLIPETSRRRLEELTGPSHTCSISDE
jgi:PHS family inorganic phosphate transporter-like MFS transporter